MAAGTVSRPAKSRLRDLAGIFTASPRMDEVFRLIQRAARADCTVLVAGETGTGKELAARAIHVLGPRRKGPLRGLNCATLSPTLLESELFGHVRGAFTGAIRDKKGEFSLADGGTLFLDEVADIPADIQGRLLRVLQSRTFVPVGATRTIKVDVRLVSATNKNLAEEVAAGRFRADLAYRIRVVPLQLPPLRERTGDAEALFWHFVGLANARGLRRVEAASVSALAAIRSYHWPGNVRELINAVEYAFVVGEGEVIGIGDLPPELRGESGRIVSPAPTKPAVAAERGKILAALERTRWSRSEAARALGISRATLWRKMREHGIAARG